MYCIQHAVHVHTCTCMCLLANYHLEVWKVSKYKNYKTVSEDDRKEVHVYACIGRGQYMYCRYKYNVHVHVDTVHVRTCIQRLTDKCCTCTV